MGSVCPVVAGMEASILYWMGKVLFLELFSFLQLVKAINTLKMIVIDNSTFFIFSFIMVDFYISLKEILSLVIKAPGNCPWIRIRKR